MKYKIIFDTTGLLSNNQIAQILNAIQPKEVESHQQATNKLLLYASFDNEIDVAYINNRLTNIDFCVCKEVIYLNEL